MNELLGKVTNFAYEIFGVFLPGIVLAVFMLAWWCAMGSFGELVVAGLVPALNPNGIPRLMAVLMSKEAFVPLVVVVYLLGHLLLWVARSGPALERHTSWAHLKRIGYCLQFRIPKPSESFDPLLRRLFDEGAVKLSSTTTPLVWREFFPVAKSFIAQRSRYSLLSTYQNKYTLHRSLTTAATLLWWLSLLGLIGALVARCWTQTLPHHAPLVVLAAFALLVVWGFSDSYQSHWRNWGNAIVTEAYTLLIKGDHDEKKSKPAGG